MNTSTINDVKNVLFHYIHKNFKHGHLVFNTVQYIFIYLYNRERLKQVKNHIAKKKRQVTGAKNAKHNYATIKIILKHKLTRRKISYSTN